jgi:hypothetical protein
VKWAIKSHYVEVIHHQSGTCISVLLPNHAEHIRLTCSVTLWPVMNLFIASRFLALQQGLGEGGGTMAGTSHEVTVIKPYSTQFSKL